MVVQEKHRQFVVDNMGKMSTKAIRENLMKQLLTKSQANSCIRNQRVKAGEYKNASIDATHKSYKGKSLGKWKFKGGDLSIKKREKTAV